MVDLMMDLNAAEAFIRKIGLKVDYNNVWPPYDTNDKCYGNITHPILYDFLDNTAIFVTFIRGRGYKIYGLRGQHPNGTVIFDRSEACKVIVPGTPGWEERIIKEVEEIRNTLSRYYKIYMRKKIENDLSVLE